MCPTEALPTLTINSPSWAHTEAWLCSSSSLPGPLTILCPTPQAPPKQLISTPCPVRKYASCPGRGPSAGLRANGQLMRSVLGSGKKQSPCRNIILGGVLTPSHRS